MIMGIFLEPLLALLAIFLPIAGCYALIEIQTAHKETRQPKASTAAHIRAAIQKQAATIVARSYSASSIKYAHICPTCGRKHLINDAMQRVAYGRQYTCSPGCEIKRRKASGHLW